MFKKRLSVLPQYVAPQRALSHLAGWLSERRWIWFKNWQINYLVERYGVDMQAALSANLDDYPTFNSFFTRQLKPELRPVVQLKHEIACPADGTISQAGSINEDLLFQAKGFHFSLEKLLGAAKHLPEKFYNGRFATVYLSPKDYHRVHMPFAGTLRETLFIPGKLFSVNTKTANAVPNLFARNERLCCVFDTELGPMAVILVGAMLVGSIETAWGDKPLSRKIRHRHYPTEGSDSIHLEKGAEMGHFRMGSTVIVLFAKDKISWAKSVHEGNNVKMGELFGTDLTFL